MCGPKNRVPQACAGNWSPRVHMPRIENQSLWCLVWPHALSDNLGPSAHATRNRVPSPGMLPENQNHWPSVWPSVHSQNKFMHVDNQSPHELAIRNRVPGCMCQESKSLVLSVALHGTNNQPVCADNQSPSARMRQETESPLVRAEKQSHWSSVWPSKCTNNLSPWPASGVGLHIARCWWEARLCTTCHVGPLPLWQAGGQGGVLCD